jgi:hypothetical protein
MSRTVQALRGLVRPERILRAFIRRWKLGPFEFRMDLDAFSRPWYAYCLWRAAQVSHRLGLPKISAIEFGVAGGAGLLELERLAEEIEKSVPIRIETYGFDLGTGLPQHSDFRDLPYIWRSGFYQMDEAGLRRKLKRSTLIIGNVKETAAEFLSKYQPPPIGFVSFDMDYYSSTRDAFALFDGPHNAFLPRIFCYFDDVVGDDAQLHSDYAGELLAIREFNEAHADQKISKINGLASKRPFECPWADSIYVAHRFGHGQYESYIGSGENTA